MRQREGWHTTAAGRDLSNRQRRVYLDEMEWRFNGRKKPYLFRDIILALIHSSNLLTPNSLVSNFPCPRRLIQRFKLSSL